MNLIFSLENLLNSKNNKHPANKPSVMESCFQTTSWQTPLSAEYYNCVSPSSPGSPVSSPSSPTLYQNSLCVKDNETSGTRIDLGLFKDSSGAVPSRSQNVCSLLEEIESLQTFDLSLPAGKFQHSLIAYFS